MNSSEIRQTFLDFFKSKEHSIVSSAPMVIKDDPTLMFTNAGMNQFKDFFLGNMKPKSPRIADTQKCLRVSGKHNDLEEVGHDTYHHTMFEMLGNWSFGDYFKKEAIEWGWELLADVYGISKKDMYVTVFGGDDQDAIPSDDEAHGYWKQILPEDRILFGSRKDNFWEMGDTGPCGPCSEIHVDLRSEAEKELIPGRDLVNKDHPLVIELWNLVFIEFNRKSDGKLEPLPNKHIDTGMGFERLAMVLQGKKSNYDTDIFQPVLNRVSDLSGIRYGSAESTDIAMRVVADHLRAVAFAIADGQLPSNTGAGYVIRRILRRAIRYGFTFLGLNEPFVCKLVDPLVKIMGDHFPELKAQKELITRVITEEETAFLRTLSQGIKRFEQYIAGHADKKRIAGDFAFELFDTYGFPVDLTQLMAQEKGWEVDMQGFTRGLEEQKSRSRKAAETDMHDWIQVNDGSDITEFIGYSQLSARVRVIRFRKIKSKKGEFFEVVLDKTPFYAESGGQVGDRGYLEKDDEKLFIIDTYKENELIIHRIDKVPANMDGEFLASVNADKRNATANNHSATHLMHAALRDVLGNHVEQKGSLVDDKRLRFDFSHFSRMTEDEIREVERIVNRRIRENIVIDEKREVPFNTAIEMGAIALFGEKYGDSVRVITFDKDFSVELCGGTHVPQTGQIGFFKILSEGAIAAGIRRVEAVTGARAEDFIFSQEDLIRNIQSSLKNVKDLDKGVRNLLEENKSLQKKVDSAGLEMARLQKGEILSGVEKIGEINFIARKIDGDAGSARNLAFSMKDDLENMVVILGTSNEGKANLTIMISDSLIKDKGLHAGNLVRDIAGEIKGGGGGQPHFAVAGGKDPSGLERAFAKARDLLSEK